MDSESELQELKPPNNIEMESIDIDSESDSELISFCKKPDDGVSSTNSTSSNVLIPEISKDKYEAVYNSFMQWSKDQKMITSYSENVLLTYFGELSTKFKATTLLTQYSMLRTTLNINHNVDISKYTKLRAFLKRRFDGYRPKRAKFFTPDDVKKFLKEAPDNQYLLAKVVLIMGVAGACRREELHKMRIHDLRDFGSAVLVEVPQTNKKKKPRRFTITGQLYKIYKKYAILRPANTNHPWFFLNYNNNKCNYLKIGINKFGNLGKEIAKYLKLPNPELYTGHCFRRSSGTVFIDSEEDIYLERRSTPRDEGLSTKILNWVENSESGQFETAENTTTMAHKNSENCNEWRNVKTENVETEPGPSTFQETLTLVNSENIDISSQNEAEDESISRPTISSNKKTVSESVDGLDEIDFFFKSIAISVKKLSPELRNEAKLRTLQLVCELESRNVINSAGPKREPSPSTSCSS